jgi:phosphate transport system substrate-binding protein
VGKFRSVAAVAAVALLATACGNAPGDQASTSQSDGNAASAPDDGSADAGGEPSGSIAIDGSSTVGPLTDAVAQRYAPEAPNVTVNLSISGTGGGFERFCNTGDTHISNASRPIKEAEAQTCEDNGIDYIEVRVATDALTMVAHPETEFVSCLTQDEVVDIWGPDGADNWSQVRDGFPDQKLAVFAPGSDSGTYDFFNETVLEPNDITQPRQDYNASEDDNVIAQGIIGTPGSWGYFGYAYYQQNTDRLTALAYDAGDGCVEPSAETAQDDSYKLARPLFIYVKKSALADEHVADFVNFYLDNVNAVVGEVGYIAASQEELDQARQKVADAIEAAE